MSDQTNPTQEAPATQAAVQSPPVAPSPSASDGAVNMSSEALAKRLEDERARERKKVLREYGVDKEDDLKALLESGRKAADERKTELERLSSALEVAKKGSERATELEALVSELTASELSRLPEKVRETVQAKHPDDPKAQIALVKVMRDAGLLDAAATAPATAASATAPAAAHAPANAGATAPAPSASPVPTKFDEYQRLLTKDPLGASIFLETNRLAVEASRPPQS